MNDSGMTDDGKGSEWKKVLSEHLAQLEALAAKLPAGKLISDQTRVIRELLLEQRPPRIALVGRRGSGKSSLINALFGAEVAAVGHESAQTGSATWFTFRSERGAIDILDTRGFQEGAPPSSVDPAKTAIASVRAALDERCPDAVLFLVKAKEVDAAIEGDLESLRAVFEAVKKRHGATAPFVAVATQCDELEPRSTRLHAPDEDADDLREKRDRVHVIERVLEDRLKADNFMRDRLVRVLGVSAYQSWRRDGTVREDARWQIELLVEYLLRELPGEARVELVRVSMIRKLQRELANKLVHAVSMACATIAATPIPIADLAVITPLQLAMVTGIAYVGGRSVDARGVGEFLAAMGVNVGAGFAFREAARALVKLIPVAGGFVSGAVAYAGSAALGTAAIAYFIDERTGAEAKASMNEARKAAKAEFERNTPTE